MKILIIVALVIAVLVLLAIAIKKVCDIRHRRWCKWFDSLPDDEKRKYQEDMHKAQAYRNS